MPDQRYDDLSINNGTDARDKFYKLQHKTDAAKVKAIREELLEYCGLDTLAMVKVLEKISLTGH